jgi:hypothetical protein
MCAKAKALMEGNAKSLSINSSVARQKVCECFKADIFQAIKLVYGHAQMA